MKIIHTKGTARKATVLAFTLIPTAATMAICTEPAQGALSGQNGNIAYASTDPSGANWDIYTVDSAGRSRRLTTKASFESDPVFSPDGKHIAFATTADGDFEVYVMNAADGTHPQNISNNHKAEDRDPAFSPDGSQLAFASRSPGPNAQFDIYTDDGTSVTNVTEKGNVDDATQPAFSPDGGQIAFTGNKVDNNNTTVDIYVMNIDGTGFRRLTKTKAKDTNPAWSPDGSRIVFDSDAGPNQETEIWSVNPTSGLKSQLTPNSDNVDEHHPTFSPDGSRILFVSNRDNNHSALYTMNANAADPTDVKLVKGAGDRADTPDWQARGDSSPSPTPSNTAPSISKVAPVDGSHLESRTPVIKARVRDAETELAKTDIKMSVDGKSRGFDYDASTGRLRRQSNKLSRGKHTVKITATDQQGAKSENKWSFEIK